MHNGTIHYNRHKGYSYMANRNPKKLTMVSVMNKGGRFVTCFVYLPTGADGKVRVSEKTIKYLSDKCNKLHGGTTFAIF